MTNEISRNEYKLTIVCRHVMVLEVEGHSGRSLFRVTEREKHNVLKNIILPVM